MIGDMKRRLMFLGIIIIIIAGIVGAQIGLNKIDKVTYSKIDDVDQKMFKELSIIYDNFRNSSDKLWDANYHLDKMPIVLTRMSKLNGVIIQYSYILNFDGAKTMFNAKEIEMPKELNLPTVYRLDRFAPSTLFAWAPLNFGALKLDEKEVFYFKYYPDMITSQQMHFDFPFVLLNQHSRRPICFLLPSIDSQISNCPNN